MSRPNKPWFRSGRNVWCITINGQTHTLAKGKEAKEEAFRKFHEMMSVRGLSRPADSSAHTVLSLFDTYLKHADGRMDARSFDERRRIMDLFAMRHGHRPVDQVKAIHLQQWLDSQSTWTSDWTRAHVVAVIKRPFNWAVKMGIIPFNPVQNVTSPTGSPRRPMTPREFSLLMKGAPGPRGKRFRQVAAFLRLTGARPGEASSIQWSDIDLDRRVITLKAHKTAKKTRKDRIIHLTQPVVLLLQHRHKDSGQSKFVFLNERKNPWNRCSLSLRLQRCRDRQGIPMDAKLYGLRHAFGTNAIVNGVDIKTLSVLMGHESTRMTEHYLHLASRSEHLELSMRQASLPRRKTQSLPRERPPSPGPSPSPSAKKPE